MKKIFNKAFVMLAGAAMIGATAGVGAAPFPGDLTADNAAIVVGGGAASSDNIAAASIANLIPNPSSGGGTPTGGDVYKFEKTNTKFNPGDNIADVISLTLDDDELPNLLAEGEYTDDDNDEFDFTQKITMTDKQLTFFEDNDYEDEANTLGFKYNNNDQVLSYTLEFSDEPAVTDMANSDLTIMGKEYYVLSATVTKWTILDSAGDTILGEGDTATLNVGGEAYAVTINFISDTEVILTVNGENTNSLGEGETYPLDGGEYVGIKDILYDSKDTGISKVEFSIGTGKLVLENGQDIEVNDDSFDGMTSTITNSSADISSLVITWAVDDEEFVTEDSSLTMPIFENVVMSFGGVTYEAEEEIRLENDGEEGFKLSNFPLKDAEEDINLVYATTSTNVIAGIGKDSTNTFATAAPSANLSWDGSTDDYFIVSYADTLDAESYYVQLTGFTVDGSTNETNVRYRKDGAWVTKKSGAQDGEVVELGSATITIHDINEDAETATVEAGANTNFNELYSAEGLRVYLPFDSLTATTPGAINLTANPTSFSLVIDEEDKDGNLGSGTNVTFTLGYNSDNESSVTTITNNGAGSSALEIDDTNEYTTLVYSELATMIHHDRDPNQRVATIVYHGEEAVSDVYLTSSETTFGGDSAGVMTYTDAEASSYAGMHLVVVGGSCINSVAAELLGGALCEADFTAATGVGDGEFLIESFDRSGNTALVVAGYNAADTTKAATYLVNNAADVDMTVGNKYTGSTATEATLVVA